MPISIIRQRFVCVVVCGMLVNAAMAVAATSTSDAAGKSQITGTAHLPCLSGWPAPVAAIYADQRNFYTINEWRREPFPVGVAVWSDGTIVWSLDQDGFRAPYAIGRLPERLVQDFLLGLDSQGYFVSPHAVSTPTSEGSHTIMAFAVDGKGVTFERRRQGGGKVPTNLGQANWDVLEGELRGLVKSAAIATTRPLVFGQRCVTTMQPVLPATRERRFPDETRAVWISNCFVEESPEKQDRALDLLSRAGFNRVFVNTQWRMWVQYPGSEYLDQSPFAEGANALVVDTLVSAIHDKGMRAEAFPEYGFYASYDRNTTDSYAGLLSRHPALTAVDKDGRGYFYNPAYGYYKALCPANPESHKLLIGLYSEMLERYPFDGINLDRIRFPNADFCHCDFCRKRFAEDTGTSLTVFAEGSAEWTAWMEWRKARVTDFMRSFSKEIRAKFPGRTITACAVPPEEMDAKGQDWPAWVEEDLVDAVVPLLYSGSDKAAGMAAIQKLVPDQSRVIYGLLPWEGVGDDICKMRQAGGRGYAVWHIGTLTPAARDAFEEANTPFGPGPSTLAKPH